MSRVIYKTLFEVQLLHEYYVTNVDGINIFNDINNKEAFLQNRFNKSLSSISNDVVYQLPNPVDEMFRNHYLKLVPAYSGFSILARVYEVVLADGTILYEPYVKLPSNANLLTLVSLKNHQLAAVTNKRINQPIPAAYYFTNLDIISTQAFPVLAAGVPDFDESYHYQQGELYVDENNNTVLYFLDGNNPVFLPVKVDGYASSSDELVVPLQFIYKFNAGDKVTKANFELTDSKGNIVRSYLFENNQPLQKQAVNFTHIKSTQINPGETTVLSLPLSPFNASVVYSLKVTINDAKILLHKIIFFDNKQDLQSCLAIVNINPVAENPQFSLYAEDGFIKHRKLPDGAVTPAPVFEVRIKSRVSFWRYINEKHAKLKADTYPDFLQRSGSNNLVSKVPRPFTALAGTYVLRDENGKIISEKYLPNPQSDERLTIEEQKIYADIQVATSAMFPLDTS